MRYPLVDFSSLLVGSKRRDVFISPRGKNRTYWWDDPHRKTSTTKNHMNKRSPNSTVAVNERMDRLKLRMNDCSLSNRRNIRSRGELYEVVHESIDCIRCRWDVRCVEWSVI